METAREMIKIAAACGARYAKFQKRDVYGIPQKIAARERHDAHAFGKTEREHRMALEFTIEQHHELMEYARTWEIEYACSAWDETSAQNLIAMGAPYVKIPSAMNRSFLKWAIPYDTVPIHVSLGMTTMAERTNIIFELLKKTAVKDDLEPTFYSCISKYPAKHADVCLLDIRELSHQGLATGYSGHHNGIALDIAAFLCGATIIERHFTLDRTAKGTDHAASLEPQGFYKLSRDLEAVAQAMKAKPDDIPECEREMLAKLKEGA